MYGSGTQFISELLSVVKVYGSVRVSNYVTILYHLQVPKNNSDNRVFFNAVSPLQNMVYVDRNITTRIQKAPQKMCFFKCAYDV